MRHGNLYKLTMSEDRRSIQDLRRTYAADHTYEGFASGSILLRHISACHPDGKFNEGCKACNEILAIQEILLDGPKP
jgi:hypothetical protein